MSDEAIPSDIMKAAEEQLRSYYVNYQSRPGDAIVQIIARAIQAERARVHGYAARLLMALAEQHFPDRHPDFAPLSDVFGVIDQIDNMTTGMARRSDEHREY